MFHVTIKTSLTTGLCALALMTMPTLADAQQQTFNAAGQARAKMQQSHTQTGSIGGGYRPYSAWTYQNAAVMHANVLNASGQQAKQLPPETAKEHLTEIRRNIEASKKELSKFDSDSAAEAGVKSQIEAIEKHLMAAEECCTMMDKTITKEGVKATQMCSHCMDAGKELQAAQEETLKLMKTIGIAPPPAAHMHEHDSPSK